MEMKAVVDSYRMARDDFYLWRCSTETAHKVTLALVFACLTGAGALLRVYTPLSPVPFTSQVFFVLLSGLVLGSAYGGLSQMIYLVLGIVGIPWFAGGNVGYEYVMGATGGYLVGFILAAALVGWFADRYVGARTLRGLLPVMMLGILVIYGIGAIWLAVLLDLSAWQALVLGVLPFIWLDVIKACLAAGVGRMVTTRVPYC